MWIDTLECAHSSDSLGHRVCPSPNTEAETCSQAALISQTIARRMLSIRVPTLADFLPSVLLCFQSFNVLYLYFMCCRKKFLSRKSLLYMCLYRVIVVNLAMKKQRNYKMIPSSSSSIWVGGASGCLEADAGGDSCVCDPCDVG